MSINITNTINRVIVLKVTPTEAGAFAAPFNLCFQATRSLFNEVACWGMDTVTRRDFNPAGAPLFIETNLITERKAIYNKTDKSITFDDFSKLLKVLYNAFITSSEGRGLNSAILGDIKVKDTLTSQDWLNISMLVSTDAPFGKINENKGLLYRVSNTLKAIGFRNREPYNLQLAAGERYSVTANVHRMLTSWRENNTRTIENYATEVENINNRYLEIDPEILPTLKMFFDECLHKSFISHFDPRVRLYLKDCVIPALKGGTEITEHFFIEPKDGNHIQYSLHPDFIELLKSSPVLWQGEDPYILKSVHILEALMTHESNRPNSAYPFIGESDTHRFSYFLGTNYTKYSVAVEGPAVEGDFTLETTNFGKSKTEVFTSGQKIDRMEFKVTRGDCDDAVYAFKLHTQDKYYGGTFKPNTYLNNASVWTNKSNQAIYLQIFRKGLPVGAVVREPAIICKGGEYFIRLNMVVYPGDNSNTLDVRAFNSTAAPSAKTNRSVLQDSDKNLERWGTLKGKTYKYLGVDLGLRSPFSWAVGESTLTSVSNKVTILETGEYTAPFNPTYWTLENDCKNVGKILGITKSLAMGKTASFNNYMKITIKSAQDFFSSYSKLGTRREAIYREFTQDTDPYNTLMNLLTKHNCDLIKVKQDPSFIGSILLSYLNLKFGELTEKRRMHLKDQTVDSKFSNEYNWLSIIEQLKRVSRSLSYKGTDNTRTPINLKNLTKSYNNCKANLLKQYSSMIATIAYNKGCSVIVLEDLKGASKSLTSRESNFLQAFWSPTMVKSAIENAAGWYGIAVAEVSESQTSQIHFETGKFGHRDRAFLYYEDADGSVKSTHADMNAAKNIVSRFASRHTDLHQVSLKSLRGKPLEGEAEDANTGKRLPGYLTFTFGSVNNGVEFFKAKDSTVDLWYRDGDEWISKETRNERREAIKAKVEALRVVPSVEKPRTRSKAVKATTTCS